MYQDKINAYFDNPAVQRELVGAIARLVSVKSVKGES